MNSNLICSISSFINSLDATLPASKKTISITSAKLFKGKTKTIVIDAWIFCEGDFVYFIPTETNRTLDRDKFPALPGSIISFDGHSYRCIETSKTLTLPRRFRIYQSTLVA